MNRLASLAFLMLALGAYTVAMMMLDPSFASLLTR